MSASKSRSVQRLVLLLTTLVAVAAMAAAAFYLKENQLPKRLAVVEPGILFRCAQPKTAQLDNVIDTHGIKTLLIVREGVSRAVPDEMEHARSHGLKVVHIPIESRKPITDDQVKLFFEVVDNPANHPVLVHCSAGRHRTGYLCALYRIERMSWPVGEALTEMLSFGFDSQDQSVVLNQLKAYEPGTWKRSASASSVVGARSASKPS